MRISDARGERIEMNLGELIENPNKDENRREWPSDEGRYEITFAVSIDGDAVLVSAPESVCNANDECAAMDKHGWDDLPTAPGFYKATAEFWFQDGYYEGYPDPGESSFGFVLLDCAIIDPAEIARLSALSASQEQAHALRDAGAKL